MKKLIILVLVVVSIAWAGSIMTAIRKLSSPVAMTSAPASEEQTPASADSVRLTGTVSMDGKYLPGLSVYLVSKVHGRTYPVYTDDLGKFEFPSTIASENELDTFYLEIYWGRTLVYQGKVLLMSPVLDMNIVLR